MCRNIKTLFNFDPLAERIALGAIGMALTFSTACADTQERLNPVIGLHEQGQPQFGMYAPANRRGRGGGPGEEPKTPAQLAQETLGFTGSDYIFSGSMEGSVERGLPAWTSYVEALVVLYPVKVPNSNTRREPLTCTNVRSSNPST